MKMQTGFLMYWALLWLTTTDALRVLVVFPMVSKSHSILGHGFVNNLLKGGHEVVHLTSFPRKQPHPKLKEIDVSTIAKTLLDENSKSEIMSVKNNIGQSTLDESLFLMYFTYALHEQFFYEPSIVELLSDPKEKFDAVIVEWFFSDILAGLAPLLQCPLIWFGTTEPHWQVLRLMDEIPNPAYTVDIFALSKPPLNFWQRANELWKIVKRSLLGKILALFENSLYNKVYPEMAAKRGVTMPSYDEAVYNGSLMFLNAHPSLGSAHKLPENVINIAGYHIDDNPGPLPKDLQKLMDEAAHGIIYFSMGSNLESKGMSDSMKNTLLGVFGKLKETVIWKFEGDLENVPKNVHLVTWAPQQSILAHPNLKFFITHGGQLSTTEAVYYGVPLIGLPVLGDQTLNMATVQSKGFGIKVTISEYMGEELTAAINEMISSNKYKLRAKELSAIYHDRVVSPGEELLHWVQHVVKTKGAPHLKSPALHVPLYQKLFLDLAAVIIIASVLMTVIVKKILQRNKVTKQNGKKKRN